MTRVSPRLLSSLPLVACCSLVAVGCGDPDDEPSQYLQLDESTNSNDRDANCFGEADDC